jgi:hypothetical protein
MSIDLNKIRSLISKVDEARQQAADDLKREEEDRNKTKEKALRDEGKKKHVDVEEKIKHLQNEIERATLAGNRSLCLLWLDPKELRFAPRPIGGLFRSEMVNVYLGRNSTKPSSILRGYKPNCLPDYARKLFDYCKNSGLITLLKKDKDYSGIVEAENERWKKASYAIQIYW